MTIDELRSELQGLADSTDDHIDTETAVDVISDLADRIRTEGLTESNDLAAEAARLTNMRSIERR